MTAERIRITSEEEARAILAEVRRIVETPRPELVDHTFPKQAAFIEDRSTFKAAKCSRRAGKSRGIGMWLLEPLFDEPGVTTLYLAKTRQSAEEIMWGNILKVLNREKGLGLRLNESDLTLTNEVNESKLRLGGADASPDEMTKYLGGKLKRVAIDEAAEFRQNLEKLVYEILFPALADHDGELALLSTAGSLLKGLFYEVTRPDLAKRRKGWSVHEWTSLDNPYMREKILKQIAKLKEDNPRIEETPWFRRSYLNEWVSDSTKQVYRYDPSRNDLLAAPDPRGRLHVLGVDLGFTDATAFAVASFSMADRYCDFVDSHKASGLDLTAVAERIRYYQRLYNPYAIVVDGAAKQAVEELKNRHQLPLIAADKQGKADIIAIYSAELIMGRIRYVQPAMEPITSEYPDLIWDEKSSRKEEHPACENHGADACLYAWRHCFYHLAHSAPEKVKQSDEERIDEWADAEAERLAQSRLKPFWDRS